MANLMDWSRKREGWWMGVGMGEEEGEWKERGGKIWWKWE